MQDLCFQEQYIVSYYAADHFHKNRCISQCWAVNKNITTEDLEASSRFNILKLKFHFNWGLSPYSLELVKLCYLMGWLCSPTLLSLWMTKHGWKNNDSTNVYLKMSIDKNTFWNLHIVYFWKIHWCHCRFKLYFHLQVRIGLCIFHPFLRLP